MGGAHRPEPQKGSATDSRAERLGACAEAAALAAALGLHAGALLLRFLAPNNPLASLEAPAQGTGTVEVELVEPSPARAGALAKAPHEQREEPDEKEGARAREPERPAAAAARPAAERPAAERSVARAPGPGAGAPEGPDAARPAGAGGEPARPAPQLPPSEYGPPPGVPGGGGPAGVPGLDGRPVWSMPGVLPEAPGPAPAPTAPRPGPEAAPDVASKVLAGTLRKKDQELGLELPAGGLVASSLSDAVRGSEAPSEARATFEVDLGARGEVLGVRFVSASAGHAGVWERVAHRAKQALAARALDMGPEGKAAKVVVKIESQLRYPAGGKKSVDVRPVCADEVIENIEQFLKDPNAVGPGRATVGDKEIGNGPKPLAGDDDEAAPRRKVCIPVAVRGKGDVSNLGANAQTIVRASYQVLRRGEKVLPSAPALPLDDRAPWLAPDPSKAPRLPPPKKKKKRKAPS